MYFRNKRSRNKSREICRTSLQKGQKFILMINDIQGDINKASVSHKGIVKDLKPGIIVLIDDGLLS